MKAWMRCEVCGEGVELHEAVAEWQLSQGRLRREEISSETGIEVMLVGTCVFCQASIDRGKENEEREIEEGKEKVRKRWHERGSVGQETAWIARRLRELGQEHPDWSRQECSTHAVEEHNSIENEPNNAFRAYLAAHQ